MSVPARGNESRRAVFEYNQFRGTRENCANNCKNVENCYKIRNWQEIILKLSSLSRDCIKK